MNARNTSLRKTFSDRCHESWKIAFLSEGATWIAHGPTENWLIADLNFTSFLEKLVCWQGC